MKKLEIDLDRMTKERDRYEVDLRIATATKTHLADDLEAHRDLLRKTQLRVEELESKER